MKEITKNEFKLMERIVELSVADNFREAKLEWILLRVYKGVGVCICGHAPIFNLCILLNHKNKNRTIVGSTCVQKFIGIKTEHLFKSYKEVNKDTTVPLGEALIDYLYARKVINEWEQEFLMSTAKKKFEWLSDKQKAKRIQINRKVLEYMELGYQESGEEAFNVKDLETEWWK